MVRTLKWEERSMIISLLDEEPFMGTSPGLISQSPLVLGRYLTPRSMYSVVMNTIRADVKAGFVPFVAWSEGTVHDMMGGPVANKVFYGSNHPEYVSKVTENLKLLARSVSFELAQAAEMQLEWFYSDEVQMKW